MAQTGTAGRATLADARLVTGVGWVIGLSCSALTLASDDLLFGYHSPDLHLVLNAVDACVALLLTYLLVGRFRRTRRLQDLLLGEALLLLAVAGLATGLLLDVERPTAPDPGDVWWPLTLRVTAAVLVVAAAVAGDRTARSGRVTASVAGPGLVLAVGLVLVSWWGERLPAAPGPEGAQRSDLTIVSSHPSLVAVQALGAACFLVASVAFAGQAWRRADELLRWAGPACALAGFARLSYAVFPSWSSGWLYTGDLLRLGCYLCLLVGATREIGRYWTAYTRVAVVEDRRRLARELHDGVLQELRLVKSLAGEVSAAQPEVRRAIVDACDRAVDEARAAVEAWGRAPDEPLAYVLHRAARDVAERYGGKVAVELDDAVRVAPSQRHDLARITREAVGNAVRHGAATCVRLKLEPTANGGRLVVRDDGRGFDPGALSGGTGYGLTSMRERARGLPGSLELQSRPGEGTSVVVTW